MKCRKAQELFSSYLENTIQPPMGVALEQHLAECDRCKAEYGRFHATTVVLDELPYVEPPPDLHAMIMARVEQAHRAAPRPVRWWSVDWQRAFTVRVPAKAVALCAAALLMFVVLAQFGPLHTITANMLGGSRATVLPHEGAPMPLPSGIDPDSDAKYVSVGAGLSIGVRVVSASASGTIYAMRLAASDTPVRVHVSVLPQGGPTSRYRATVSKNQEAVVSVTVTQANGKARADLAIVTWTSGGQSYGEYVFMPSAFGLADKNASISMFDVGAFELLSRMSSAYGTVILAPDYLADKTESAQISARTANEAARAASKQTDLVWRAEGSSVYVVR